VSDRRLGAVIVAGAVALLIVRRRAGSRAAMPGDALVAHPNLVTTHATTIAAPAAQIWPWLVQMGWHRGGWYTARWVDRLLFPANRASADRIEPELQHLGVGDFVPDGPPGTGVGFTIVALEPDRHLVLRSQSHLPPGWHERFGARIDWTWAFVLDPVDAVHTRFVFRSRARVAPRWVAVCYRLAVVPADLVMGRQMLRGVKRRAEGAPTAAPGHDRANPLSARR
jgi:hypothetical protein